LLAITLISVTLSGCANTNSPSPLPSIIETVTPESAGPEVIELEFTPPSAVLQFCMDEVGNIWVPERDGMSIWKIGVDRTQSVFADGLEPVGALAYGDGCVYAMTYTSEIYCFDDNGAELERYALKTGEGFMLEKIAGIDTLLVTIGNNPPICAILLDIMTKTETVLDDMSATSAYPLSNGQIIISTPGTGLYALDPLKNMVQTTPIDDVRLLSAKYDRYTEMIICFANGTLEARETLEGRSRWLVDADNPDIYGRLYTYTCANGRVAVLFGTTIHVFNIADRIESARNPGKVLTVLNLNYNPYDEESLFYKYLAQYRKAHPEVEITSINIQLEMSSYDKAFLDIMAGVLQFDVMLFDDVQSGAPFVETGMLCDLNEFPVLQMMMDSPRLIEGVRELCVDKNGVMFGIPVRYGLSVYAVNQELFEELRLPIPAWNWTLNDYFELGAVAWHGFDGNGVPNVLLYPISFVGNGFPNSSVFYQKNGFRMVLDTPEYIDYVRKTFEIWEKYGDYSWWHRVHGLPVGSVLMNRLSLGNKEDFLEITEDTILLSIPDFHCDTVPPYISYLGIYRNATDLELAAEFLAGFLSEDFNRENAGYENLIYRDIVAYQRLPNNLPGNLEALISYANKSYDRYMYIPRLNIWQYTELFPRYESGELTLEQALRLLQQEAEKYLEG